MVNLAKDFGVIRVGSTRFTSIARRDYVAREYVNIGFSRLLYGLFYGGTFRAVTRSRTCRNRTEVSCGERVLAHLFDNLVVINGGKVSFLDFSDEVFVEYEYKVVYRVGTQVAVIVVVARVVLKPGHKFRDTFRNCLTFEPRSRFTRSLADCSRYVDFYVFRSLVGLRSADKYVVSGCVVYFLGFTNHTEHNRRKGRERTFRTPCTFREIVVDGKRNLSELIETNSLYVGVFGSVKFKKVKCFRVCAPRRRMKYVYGIVEFRVAVKRAVYSRHIDEVRHVMFEIVSEYLLTDNHIVKSCENFVRL